MVHALSEIQRVLAPGGALIDLRPHADRWEVEVAAGGQSQEVGRVTDLAEGFEDDQAADESMESAAAQNWFRRERHESFPFFYYWDSPNEMQEYVEQDWEGIVSIEDELWKKIRSTWATANAEARLRVRVKMLITCWKKI